MNNLKLILSLAFLFSIQTAFAEPNCSRVHDQGSFWGLKFDFKTSCFKHDVCYSESGLSGKSKAECDREFYDHMRISCANQRGFYCKARARVYYEGIKRRAHSAYRNGYNKGRAIIKKLENSNNERVLDHLAKRYEQQERWIYEHKRCLSQRSKSSRVRCISRLNKMKVVNLPWGIKRSRYNILGINWVRGHRTANAHVQGKKFGVRLDARGNVIKKKVKKKKKKKRFWKKWF